ncbi:MAG TPA: tetratricopeptide repeat protein [Terriglobia bacterium]|jgi:tetratricopeptide (TPR) repeat protein|nr:tetratricopeptide repeat protein [Terriglobia bacterium]
MFAWKNLRSIIVAACLITFVASVTLAGGVSSKDDACELAGATQALYRGDYRQAESLAESYLKLHRSSTAGLTLLARAVIAEGNYQQGLKLLATATQIDPKNVDVLYFLSQISALMAQQEFHELQRLNPNSFRVHQLMAESYRSRGDIADAVKEYKEALKLAPNSLELLVAIADLERSQFHFQSATTYYSQALKVSPRNYVSAYGMAVSYLYLQQPNAAIPYFRLALVCDPRSAAAHFGLGDALLRIGDLKGSVAELEEALRLEPRMRQAYSLLARAYGRMGMLSQAQKALAASERLSQEEIKSRQRVIDNDTIIPLGPR